VTKRESAIISRGTNASAWNGNCKASISKRS
jgi:hypothetical protein